MNNTTFKLSLCAILSAFNTAFATPGELVTITETGVDITPTVITVCLNALDPNHPLSCQEHTISKATLAVAPVDTNEGYPNAGMKVPNDQELTLNTQGSGCSQGSGDYCLFNMQASPVTINLATTAHAPGDPYAGGIIACVDETSGQPTLVLAESDLEVDGDNTFKWAASNGNVEDAKTNDGFDNTNAIISKFSTLTDTAAGRCRSLGANWYLPASGELSCMQSDPNNTWQILFEDGIQYWSSNQDNGLASRAWRFKRAGVGTSNGVQIKGTKYRLRCAYHLTE